MHLAEMVAIILGLEHGIGRTVSLLSASDVSKSSQVDSTERGKVIRRY